MNLFTILCLIVATTVFAAELKVPKIAPQCDGVDVFGVFHKNQVLAQGLNRPYQLSYHKKNHEIFFSNNIGNDTEDKFEIRRLLHNGTDSTIEEVENGFATAIDEDDQIAYFGGSSGIYKMNLDDGKVTKIIEKHNIWDMFFKKHLYFITYPDQKLYKYETKHATHEAKSSKHHKNREIEEHEVIHEKWIHEKIYQFAIDGDHDIFITNETGLFMIKNGTEHRIHVHGETVFRAIEINHKGTAYFVGRNAIYVVKKQEKFLHKIAHVKNIFGLTFDHEGMIIYSNPLKIVRLLPTECKIIDDVVSYITLPSPLPK